jgi:hypothetical protein
MYPLVNTKLQEYGIGKYKVYDAYFGRMRCHYPDIGNFDGYWYRTSEREDGHGWVICTYRKVKKGYQYDLAIVGDDPEVFGERFTEPATVKTLAELEEKILAVVVQMRMAGIDMEIK